MLWWLWLLVVSEVPTYQATRSPIELFWTANYNMMGFLHFNVIWCKKKIQWNIHEKGIWVRVDIQQYPTCFHTQLFGKVMKSWNQDFTKYFGQRSIGLSVVISHFLRGKWGWGILGISWTKMAPDAPGKPKKQNKCSFFLWKKVIRGANFVISDSGNIIRVLNIIYMLSLYSPRLVEIYIK